VGVGQVGSRLARRLQDYGCRLLLNDPPRAAQGEVGFSSLEELLQQADIICLHTPLTRTGPFPSENLLGEKELQQLQGKILLNAGRGAVINQKALKQQLQEGLQLTLLLDVFAGEPELDLELLDFCSLATPHIAGYSQEGKSRGTEALYRAWCDYLQQPADKRLEDFLPPPPVECLQLNPGWSPEEACRRAALLVYDPRADAARMRLALQQLPSAEAYQQLRKSYPLRREFSSLQVQPANEHQAKALKALGFNLALQQIKP
jgi:erythronate-4-phosphate dehydrogenase